MKETLEKKIRKVMLKSHPNPMLIEDICLDTRLTRQQVRYTLNRVMEKRQVVALGDLYRLTNEGMGIEVLKDARSVAEPQRINIFIGRYTQQFSSPARLGAMDAYKIKSLGF